MIQDTISKIEERLRRADAINEAARQELMSLLATLKAEISTVDEERAQSIAGFAQASAHEATRQQRNPELLRLSLQGLSASVDGFEKEHPALVDIVNRMATTLSSLGI